MLLFFLLIEFFTSLHVVILWFTKNIWHFLSTIPHISRLKLRFMKCYIGLARDTNMREVIGIGMSKLIGIISIPQEDITTSGARLTTGIRMILGAWCIMDILYVYTTNQKPEQIAFINDIFSPYCSLKKPLAYTLSRNWSDYF